MQQIENGKPWNMKRRQATIEQQIDRMKCAIDWIFLIDSIIHKREVVLEPS